MKKTNLFQLLVLTIFLSITSSCHKNEIGVSSVDGLSQKMVTGIAEKDFVVHWIDSHDQGLKPVQKSILENIKSHLQFNSLTIEKRNNGENLVIIPISNDVKTLLNANADYLKVNDKTIFNLMIIQNRSGKLRWSAIIAYLPKSGIAVKQLPKETIQHIINGEEVEADGIYKFINVKGRLMYQIHYEKGKLAAVGKPVRENVLGADRSKTTLSKETPFGRQCHAWYEVTTWYYADGHTEVTEEYLFTICNEDIEENGGGGGGGGDTPDPDETPDPGDNEDPNDQEIVVFGEDEVYDTSNDPGDQYQPVVSDNPAEQELDENGNVIIPPIMPYPLRYVYPWTYSYKVVGPFKINFAKAGDVQPMPVNVTYPSVLGQITRNVVCFDHNNKEVVVGPKTANLSWSCLVNKRWTYHASSQTEVRQRGLYHTKTITF